MVAEVNKIIAGELLNHRSVVIPGVGTLYVAHRGARRLSRQKIAAPRNEIDFRPSEEGVSLVELIRRAAGCDEAQAQAVFGRWLAKTREGEVLTLEGITKSQQTGKKFRARMKLSFSFYTIYHHLKSLALPH